jgi:histone H3/H4
MASGLISKKRVVELFKQIGGGETRVSKEAVAELERRINDYIEERAKKVIEAMRHAKRKTVKPEDVKLAF